MEELIELLEDLVPGVDFKNCKNLITGKVVSSFEILSIVSGVEDEYDLEFPASELVPKNFDSVESLWALIEKLK